MKKAKSDSQAQAEEAVLDLLKADDPDAARRLIEVFGDRVYGLSLRILGSEMDAQESVQETFLTVWNKWGTFQEKSKFSSWIYRIAANHAFMMLRKRKKYQGDVSLDHVDENGASTAELIGAGSVAAGFIIREEAPDAEVQSREMRVIIEKAIESLSPTYRTAYMLKDIDGLSLKDIAEIMGLSEAAVKSRVHRARLELRRKLAQYMP